MIFLGYEIWNSGPGAFPKNGENVLVLMGKMSLCFSTPAASFAGEVVDRYRVLKERIVAGHDGDAAVGHEILLPVGFAVEADRGALRNMDIAVDDCPAYAAMTADVNVRKQNARVDLCKRIDPDIGRKDAVAHRTAGDDASGGNERIECLPGASGLLEDEFRRRILALMGTDRLGLVIQIEDRRDRHHVHVGFVIGFERAHVAPVERFLLVLVDEIEGVDPVIVDHLRQDIFPEVVAGAIILGVFQQ
jgi:hypothetical protein